MRVVAGCAGFSNGVVMDLNRDGGPGVAVRAPEVIFLIFHASRPAEVVVVHGETLTGGEENAMIVIGGHWRHADP